MVDIVCGSLWDCEGLGCIQQDCFHVGINSFSFSETPCIWFHMFRQWKSTSGGHATRRGCLVIFRCDAEAAKQRRPQRQTTRQHPASM